MAILVTGAGGFLAKALIPRLLEQGNEVYGLYHKPPKQHIPLHQLVLVGDITKEDLGLKECPSDIDSIIHCAAKLSFNPKDKEKIFNTNCYGTLNVARFMVGNKISRLYYISTAYLFDHNDYEVSKRMAEEALANYPKIRTTIIRPSIIIGDSKVEGLPPLSGFYLGIRGVDRAKRWFEKKTGVWPLRAKIRIRGKRTGKLNLIPVDSVVNSIIDIISQDKIGVFYLTHPNPPTFKALEKPVSEAIGADIKVASRFKPNVVERLAATLMKGLSPYFGGEQLPSDIDCLPLTQEFLTKTIRAFLNR